MNPDYVAARAEGIAMCLDGLLDQIWETGNPQQTMLEMAGWLVRNTGVLGSLEQLVRVLRLEDEAYRALRMADWERSAEIALAVEP